LRKAYYVKKNLKVFISSGGAFMGLGAIFMMAVNLYMEIVLFLFGVLNLIIGFKNRE
jgi:hypothetical protein